MPDVPVKADDALLAAFSSSRYLSGFWQDPQSALDIIKPYADCQEYAVGEQVKSEDRDKLVRVVRSLVCAATADCYRELGDVRTAAAWYRRAGESWMVGGFPPMYAHMVLQHGLEDHYETALDYLRQSIADWRAKPFLVRVYWHVRSGWWLRPWEYRTMWRTFFRQRSLLAELDARVTAESR